MLRNFIFIKYIRKTEVSVKSPFEYSAWAQKVFRSKMADHFKRSSRERKVFVGLDARQDSFTAGNPGLDFETLETLRRCFKRLVAVYPRYAEAVHSKHMGFDSEHICRKMKISKENFWATLSRGRSFLRECIEGRSVGE